MKWCLRHAVGTPKEIEEFVVKQRLTPKTVEGVHMLGPAVPVVVLWYWVLE